MPNILQPALRQAVASVLGAGVVEVSYQRGGEAWTINATPGRTIYEQNDDTGAIVRTEVRDWLIGQQTFRQITGLDEPQKGDRVVEKRRGVGPEISSDITYTWEVNPTPGDAPYMEMGGHEAFRIHTTQVSKT